MDTLKQKSIRIEESSLEKADDITKKRQFYSQSDVLRLSIWVGLKIVNTYNLSRLSQLQWEDITKKKAISLKDVLHAAGLEK